MWHCACVMKVVADKETRDKRRRECREFVCNRDRAFSVSVDRRNLSSKIGFLRLEMLLQGRRMCFETPKGETHADARHTFIF